MADTKDKKPSASTEDSTVQAQTVNADEIKAKAVEDAGVQAQNRINSIVTVFSENGLSSHPKMTELLTNPEAGEIDAYKACTAILKENNAKMSENTGKTSLAEQELQKMKADAEDLEEVGGASTIGAETEEGTLNMAAFTEGFSSVSAADMG